MEFIDLKSMTLDELWTLHGKVCSMLTIKLKAEKRQLEKRLDRLGGTFLHEVRQRRPYPKVYPRFRNPEPPYQTWSGRGKQPHWVSELLARGKTMDDLRILAPKAAQIRPRRRGAGRGGFS
jgi:DNA-binding protein H-NS